MDPKTTPTIASVKRVELPSVNDDRGVLTAIEGSKDIPFAIARIFYMHHVIQDRGGHAHRHTDQVLIAMSASFSVTVFDGRDRKKFILDNPTQGLYIPKMIYIELSDFVSGSVCLVLASDHYVMANSLRNIEAYTAALKD